MQDHRNDCLSNTVALLCAYFARGTFIYLDPIGTVVFKLLKQMCENTLNLGAIIVAIYIAATWVSLRIALAQTTFLSLFYF